MNTKLIKMLFSAYQLNRKMTFLEALMIMWKADLLHTGEMAERACVKQSQGRLQKNSKNKKGSDFNDGSEHKYITVGYHSGYKCGRAQITALQNKTGLVRVMVFEPKTATNYYFRVPHRVYSKVASPKVYFDSQGRPRSPSRTGANFDMWKHKCSQQEWAAK